MQIEKRVPHVRTSVRGPKMMGAALRSLSLPDRQNGRELSATGQEVTAAPSTALRSGRDDNSAKGTSILSPKNEVSSRPKRTRISCHAALDKAARAPFCTGKAHEVHQRHKVPQEIRGSAAVEGPAVSLSL